ncbi:MAG TPA: DUF4382 domain-containing protein [Agriterribacter sp.]|nr:DUF4382 domain-containing protein [Agriterribacter sp.]
MKTNSRVLPVSILLFSALLMLLSCSKSQKNIDEKSSRLELRLTDRPFSNTKAVWVDIREVEIIMNDTGHPIILEGTHPGLYNLLELTNGKDTLLADAVIPTGKISQIRLILGDNNYLITNDDKKIALKTPSAQQSGLKVQVHEEVAGGILYRLILDFDAGRSIIEAGNSGNYLLKPVLRILSLVPSGGNIQGVVVPGSVQTAIFATAGTDTIASTLTDAVNGNYLFKDIPEGNYSLVFIPSDTSYITTLRNAAVILGQVTTVDTVILQH